MVSTNTKQYLKPVSLDEAWRLMKDHGSKGKLVGGGIDVVLYGPPETEALIDVTGLGLGVIEGGKDVLGIGATATLTELLEHPATADLHSGILREVLVCVASPLLRNLATVGGAVASVHPWSDVIAVLLSLDASAVCYEEGKEIEFPLEQLLENRERLHNTLIIQVRLPRAARFAAFEKFARTGFDVGMLNCAVSVIPDGQVCNTVRMVFGGTPAIAKRLRSAEEHLEGKPLTESTIEETAQVAANALDVRDDLRASASYRRDLAAVGTRRCLKRVAERWSAGI